ncbi:MAG: response regulator [Variovorax sp.]
MPTTAYVIDTDPDARQWIEVVLSRGVGRVVFLADRQALLECMPCHNDACLILSVGVDEAATLRLVRELRSAGALIPVIVMGPHSAFRTAVDIARLEATDFLETPVTARQLRGAVRRALHDTA